MATKCYTLPIIEGKSVLVAQRELEYLGQVEDLRQLEVGQCASLAVFNAPLRLLKLSTGDGRFPFYEYQKTTVLHDCIPLPVLVWERTK